MRAVVDPNVLISAVLSQRGAPADLLRRWSAGDFELVVSPRLLAELRRALGYRKLRTRVSEVESAAFIALLERAAIPGDDPRSPAALCHDPDDDYLIALAQSSRAVLVSGDRHLLELANRFPIRSPRAFIDQLDSS